MSTKKAVLKLIHAYCIDCSTGSKREVRLCPVYTCSLHPFRLGSDPTPNQNTGFAKKRGQARDSEQGGLFGEDR